MKAVSFGLVNKWHRDELVAKANIARGKSRKTVKKEKSHETSDQRDPISLEQLQAAFFVLFSGNILSLIVGSWDFVSAHPKNTLKEKTKIIHRYIYYIFFHINT